MPQSFDEMLLCPVCSATLRGSGTRRLECPAGHGFDAARQGYFNLLSGRGTGFTPDSATMVQARIDFLGRGHYQPLADTVADAVVAHLGPEPVILDAGAGTGYYLNSVLRRTHAARPIALDISKFALRRAAKDIPDCVSLVWDVWRTLPLADQCVDATLNVFAPRNGPEFHRVTRSGGILVVATPLPGHLREIRGAFSMLGIRPDKAADVAQGLDGLFEQQAQAHVEFMMNLTPDDALNVALMGPAGHHAERVALQPTLTDGVAVTAAFTVQTFRRKG